MTCLDGHCSDYIPVSVVVECSWRILGLATALLPRWLGKIRMKLVNEISKCFVLYSANNKPATYCGQFLSGWMGKSGDRYGSFSASCVVIAWSNERRSRAECCLGFQFDGNQAVLLYLSIIKRASQPTERASRIIGGLVG